MPTPWPACRHRGPMLLGPAGRQWRHPELRVCDGAVHHGEHSPGHWPVAQATCGANVKADATSLQKLATRANQMLLKGEGPSSSNNGASCAGDKHGSLTVLVACGIIIYLFLPCRPWHGQSLPAAQHSDRSAMALGRAGFDARVRRKPNACAFRPAARQPSKKTLACVQR